MRVVIIGGTGHVGTFLVPRLVEAGHKVICISRQLSNPYLTNQSWDSVEHIIIDRVKSEDENTFGQQIKNLNPEVVIDMICFTQESAQHLVESLSGSIRHFLHCGTTWVHGHSELVPTMESQPRKPFGEYGIRKAAIESYLLSVSETQDFPATILHPGHIVGPGWVPVNPAGNLNPEVFHKLARGEEIFLPNYGMETLHHVHADDVAQSFVKAMEYGENAKGQSFHIVSEQALTLRGYASAIALGFGKEARLSFLPWEEWKKTASEYEAQLTWDHIAHSPNFSIRKAQTLLNYQPRYSSLKAIQESLKILMSLNG
jgi:nucleoside-diphosphate-sugar epimerase